MKITITVTVPGGGVFKTQAEVSEVGDTANAIRDALSEARKKNPGCSIFDSTIKLDSSGNA